MNLKLKSSMQLIAALRKVKDGEFTDEHREMAAILNERSKLNKDFAKLLAEGVVFWEDVPKGQKPAKSAPRTKSTTKEKKAPKEKKASTRVRFDNERPLELGDIVEFHASPNSKEAGTMLKGPIVGFQPGSTAEQVYARIRVDNGTKVKRDYACKLLVEESKTAKAAAIATKEAEDKALAEKEAKKKAAADAKAAKEKKVADKPKKAEKPTKA